MTAEFFADEDIEDELGGADTGLILPPQNKPLTKKQLDKIKALQDIDAMIAAFSDLWITGEYYVEIHRQGPDVDSKGNRVKVGYLCRVNDGEDVCQEYIRTRYGGGKYYIKIGGPLPPGKGPRKGWLAQSGTFQIAGDPVDDQLPQGKTKLPEGASTESQAMATMSALMETQRSDMAKERKEIAALRTEATAGNTRLLEQFMLRAEQDKKQLVGLVAEQSKTPRGQTEFLTEALRGQAGTASDISRAAQQAASDAATEHRSEIQHLRDSHVREMTAIRDANDRRERDDRDRAQERLRDIENSFNGRIEAIRLESARYADEAREARARIDTLTMALQDAKVEAAGATANSQLAAANASGVGGLAGMVTMAQELKSAAGLFSPAMADPGTLDKIVSATQAISGSGVIEKTLGGIGTIAARVATARGAGNLQKPDMTAWEERPGTEATPAPASSRRVPKQLPPRPPDPVLGAVNDEVDDSLPMSLADDTPASRLTLEQRSQLVAMLPVVENAIKEKVEPTQFAEEIAPMLGDEGLTQIKAMGASDVLEALTSISGQKVPLATRSYLRKAIGALPDKLVADGRAVRGRDGD